MENTKNVQLTQLQKLQAEKKKLEGAGSMTAIKAVALDVGIPPRQHFPNLKDSNGKTVKDEKGFAKKSETSDGFTTTLAVFGKMQFVHMVTPKPLNLQPGVATT